MKNLRCYSYLASRKDSDFESICLRPRSWNVRRVELLEGESLCKLTLYYDLYVNQEPYLIMAPEANICKLKWRSQ